MSNPESKAMHDILLKMQAASNNEFVKSDDPHVTETLSAPTNVSTDAVEMFNILNRLNEAASKNQVVVDATDAYNEQQDYDSNKVSMDGKFNIEMEKQDVVPGVAKTFYNITDHNGDKIYEYIALFESAMLVIKGLMVGKVNIKTVVEMDRRYASCLAEAALYKQKAKVLSESVKRDLALTKQTVAIDKMKMYKKKIKSMI